MTLRYWRRTGLLSHSERNPPLRN